MDLVRSRWVGSDRVLLLAITTLQRLFQEGMEGYAVSVSR
jgi:hypothetical protein